MLKLERVHRIEGVPLPQIPDRQSRSRRPLSDWPGPTTAPYLSASSLIDNCEVLAGQVSAAEHKKIRLWHKEAKSLIIEAWDDTRPKDCQVGIYRGS